ncbi:phosphatidylglycerophosphate synthetase [Wigglesworthia glossinidia endosymbiont of Glossina morsitans morsitans (Yale colony)]|uniref:CDP-diacylglycerol--glycerol-3-phosphate 3-phosphatidyltransferase n=1 Tax=Wigglesworthia glossinidia endosymbiont of Glossina morsitans morsitans (Yale colony) TaxID=1142511 RepID=H6Q502_WIGGL|nr:CDP-diacylglycerol--glycerol-3-phosphate 3-phosphatidyltransferase [Wigglesworthia glossinidia]AFA41285.1 phosphatidylglycerophosphate synthetase [Wigglesworthia glossinidia endosymbiont of Glossina morsitans morsitans (Yale colony)]
MRLNIPTYLTLFRLSIIPLFIIVFYLPCKDASLYSAIIFILAALTDWFDGFLARRLNQTTCFGAFLDPVADKIIVVIGLILIIEYFHSFWITLPSSIMITREIIIASLREWMAELGKNNMLAVSVLGKLKTGIQMLAIFALLWKETYSIIIIGILALYTAAILAFWSMLKYFYIAWRDLFEN